MSDTNKLGRPKKFDEGEALLSAMHVFWQKGYEGASIKDLCTELGINGPSLYATFGNKRDLYLKAIDAYIGNDACAPLVAFETEPAIRLAVLAFFRAVIEYATEGGEEARGCFLTACAATSAGEVDGVRDRLSAAIQKTDRRLANRFELEKTSGNLPPDFPATARARLMFDLRQGIVFRARAGLAPEEIGRDIEAWTDLVLA